MAFVSSSSTIDPTFSSIAIVIAPPSLISIALEEIEKVQGFILETEETPRGSTLFIVEFPNVADRIPFMRRLRNLEINVQSGQNSPMTRKVLKDILDRGKEEGRF